MSNTPGKLPDSEGVVTLSHAPQADSLSVWRWFGAYALFFASIAAIIVLLLNSQPEIWAKWKALFADWTWSKWWHNIREWRQQLEHTLGATPTEIKLLFLLAYLSTCTTYLPLSTGWLVAMMATRQTAVADNVLAVTLIVGAVGALGSTIANLNDYYFFTWVLRSRRIAGVRRTRFYEFSARWFARSPFLILATFTLLPIPIDVIRLLAITCRYNRLHFAAASFVGRFVRYGLFAFLTFHYDLGIWAPIFLLGLATFLVLIKGVHSLVKRIRRPVNSPNL